MNQFAKSIYSSHLVKGNLHDAIDYVKSCSDTDEMIAKYNSIFSKNEPYRRTDNDVIHDIDVIYQTYYKQVFYHGISVEMANEELFKALKIHCQVADDYEDSSMIEEVVKQLVNDKGYEFLGGKTSGYYGPYIWKSSSKETYEVELPSGIENYSVIMMTGLISRSWLDFLSLGEVGTGGWSAKDGTLCCFKKLYDLESQKFKVSFLKHEAQHSYDQKRYPHITSSELEYRAKLVELIYWHDDKIIKMIHGEADNLNKDNAHAIGSYKIIQDLSKKVFDCDYNDEIDDWTRALEKVQSSALQLLHEDDERLTRTSKGD